MAEKHTTLTQLEKLALRGRADSLLRSKETLDLVIEGLKEAQQHDGITVTLPAANWSGRAQTVKDEFFVANSKYRYIVGGDADCYTTYSETGVRAENVTVDGEITFRCEVAPDEDLTVNIIRLEVRTEEETTDEQP